MLYYILTMVNNSVYCNVYMYIIMNICPVFTLQCRYMGVGCPE